MDRTQQRVLEESHQISFCRRLQRCQGIRRPPVNRRRRKVTRDLLDLRLIVVVVVVVIVVVVVV